MTGFAAHWNKNSNLAWAFDTWFLNLFPREKPFAFNRGGYATLSFIPTLGTMILGLIAGGVLRSERAPWAKVRWLASRRRHRAGRRRGAGLAGHLPGGQAHLDAKLGPLQRRLVLPAAGGLLRADRHLGPQALGLPAGGHRHELHRRLLHGAPVRWLHRPAASKPTWREAPSQVFGRPTNRWCTGPWSCS